jgi:cell division protein YceG involved in septum cleavage
MFPKIIKTGLTLASIGLLGLLAWLAVSLYRPRAFTPGEMFVEVEKGMGANAVGRLLEEKGIISRRHSFIIGYRLFHHPRVIRAGEYRLTSPLRVKEVLDILVRGKVHLHSVTIPEGLTAQEMAPLSPLFWRTGRPVSRPHSGRPDRSARSTAKRITWKDICFRKRIPSPKAFPRPRSARKWSANSGSR